MCPLPFRLTVHTRISTWQRKKREKISHNLKDQKDSRHFSTHQRFTRSHHLRHRWSGTDIQTPSTPDAMQLSRMPLAERSHLEPLARSNTREKKIRSRRPLASHSSPSSPSPSGSSDHRNPAPHTSRPLPRSPRPAPADTRRCLQPSSAPRRPAA